jgi:hypothetical protein
MACLDDKLAFWRMAPVGPPPATQWKQSPLSVKWTGAGEHYGVREDRFWKPFNFRMRHHTGTTERMALHGATNTIRRERLAWFAHARSWIFVRSFRIHIVGIPCTHSLGSMIPRFSTVLKLPLFAWAMYMFIRT